MGGVKRESYINPAFFCLYLYGEYRFAPISPGMTLRAAGATRRLHILPGTPFGGMRGNTTKNEVGP